MMGGYFALNERLKADGVLRGGEGLKGVENCDVGFGSKAARSRRWTAPLPRRRSISGGYYIIEVADLDAALTLCALIPSAAHGTIEVRPLMDYNPPAEGIGMSNAAAGALAVSKVLDGLAREDRGRASRRPDRKAQELLTRGGSASGGDDLRDGALVAQRHPGQAAQLAPAGRTPQGDRPVRQRGSQARIGDELAVLAIDEAHEEEPTPIPDERLRPDLHLLPSGDRAEVADRPDAADAGRLSTGEIARAFLDQRRRLGQRLSRAKAKIAAAGIPFAVPEPAEWPARLDAVLAVVYLIFNAGYSAGPSAGGDLAEEAIWLGRLLDRLRPGDPENRRLPRAHAPDPRAQGRARRSNRRDGPPWPTGSEPVGSHGDRRGHRACRAGALASAVRPLSDQGRHRRLPLRRVNFRLAADRRALR